MERNVGGLDRLARLVVGPLFVFGGLLVVLDLTPFVASTAVRTGVAVVLLVLGGILLGTGAVQKCPLNRTVGVDTHDRSE
jgi:uncharacterized membrane protein YjfL (UPF0719 family)